MSTIFNRPQKKEELAVIFDIGSGSVGGALVALSSFGNPSVFYTVRHEMKLQKSLNLDFKRFISSMQETFSGVFRDLEKSGLSHLRFTKFGESLPKTVYCTLSSPWYVSHMRAITLSKKESFRVSKKILSLLVEKEIEEFKKTESQKYFSGGSTEKDVEFIEAKTIRLKLNGYEVENPYDKETQTLEALLYLCVAPRAVLENIRKKTRQVLQYKSIFFHSFAFTYFNIICDIWEHELSFLFVDISREVTEVSLVRDGVIVALMSFPIGRNTFIRKVVEVFKVSSYEGLSLLNIYMEGKGSKEVVSRLNVVLGDAKEEWLSSFGKALSEVSGGLYVPSHIFLTASDPIGSWFVRILKSKEVEERKFSFKPFTVNLLDPIVLSKFLYVGSDVRKDPFLFINTLFANKLHYPNEENM